MSKMILPNVTQTFPIGTTVAVYRDALFDSGNLSPVGTIVTEGIVDAQGSLDLGELPQDGSVYVLAARLGEAWVVLRLTSSAPNEAGEEFELLQKGLEQHTEETTTAHGGVVADGDARLSDPRKPLSHATTHSLAGSDPVSPTSIGAATGADLAAHEADATAVHGIADTAALVTKAELTSKLAVIKEAPLNVEEFGADGTGVKDSIKAFEAAIAALPAAGGEVFCPRRYSLSGMLNAQGRYSVRLVGVAGLSAGVEPASLLRFTQGGSLPLIDARSDGGVGLADLAVLHTNKGFTGSILSYAHGESGFDAAFGVVERCLIGGQNIRTALGVDLDQAIDTQLRSCHFTNCDIAARGQSAKGRYSNAITFDGCTFSLMGTIPLKNAGEAWAVRNCTFENLVSGKAGAYLSDAEVLASGLRFDTCWFGDGNAEGTWIVFRGKGLTVDAGSLGSGALGVSVPDAASLGVNIQGVRFISIVDAVRLAAGVKRYMIGGNAFDSTSGKKVSLDGGATDAGEGFLSN
jgi:hypothetical protein